MIPEGFIVVGLRIVGIENVETHRSLDESRQKLINSLETRILARDEKPFRVEWEVPATWFEHLKHSIAPQWLLRVWPVRMAKHHRDLDVRTLWPNIQLAKPHGRVDGLCTIVVECQPVATLRTPDV